MIVCYDTCKKKETDSRRGRSSWEDMYPSVRGYFLMISRTECITGKHEHYLHTSQVCDPVTDSDYIASGGTRTMDLKGCGRKRSLSVLSY
jgi:hypothetical protein